MDPANSARFVPDAVVAFDQYVVDIFNINTTPIITAEFYDYLILGIPTWHYGELQEHWEDIWDDMPKDYFQTDEHYDAMRIVQYRFPDAITIYEEDGRMKNTKHWKKAYKPKETSTLKGFFI